jgi:hypothetical protein
MAEDRIRLLGGAGLFGASFAFVAYGTGDANWAVLVAGLTLALAAIALGASSLRPSRPDR